MAENQKQPSKGVIQRTVEQFEASPYAKTAMYLTPGVNMAYIARQLPYLGDLFKGAQATSVLSAPTQVLNIAEMAGVKGIIPEEEREYLESIGKAPETGLGKIGGGIGEGIQAYYMPFGKVAPALQRTGKVARMAEAFAREGASSYAQEISRSKDPEKAKWAGALGGLVGVVGAGLSKTIREGLEAAHPSDAPLPGAIFNPKWWMEKPVRVLGDVKKGSAKRVKELVDAAMEFGQPFTVAGETNLNKMYEVVNKRMDDAIELTQKYAEKMGDALRSTYKPKPGDPPRLSTPVKMRQVFEEAVDRIGNKEAERAVTGTLGNLYDNFVKAHPELKSEYVTLEQAKALKAELAKFMKENMSSDKTMVNPILREFGEEVETAIKRSLDEAMDRVRNIAQEYGYTAPAGQPQSPWMVSANALGKTFSGTYREIAKKADQLVRLSSAARTARAMSTSGGVSLLNPKELAVELAKKATGGPVGASRTALSQGLMGFLTTDPDRLARQIADSKLGTMTAGLLIPEPPSTPKPPGVPSQATTTPPPPATPAKQSAFAEVNLEGTPEGKAPGVERQTIIENNNPMAMDPSSGTPWIGEISGGRGSRAAFETPFHGIRAGILNLQNYKPRYGAETLREIFKTYAPVGEKRGPNDPGTYAQRVAKSVGVGLDDKIDLQDPELVRKLAKAIIEVEAPAYADRYDEDIDAAIQDIFKTPAAQPGRRVPDFSGVIIK